MPYADPEMQRAYQRKWKSRRRQEWFRENGPCVECGTWENLELHHVDPTTKISHKVWSWSSDRRAAELAKCRPLCSTCHGEETRRYRNENRPEHGVTEYALGCRCATCRAAHALAARQWRAP